MLIDVAVSILSPVTITTIIIIIIIRRGREKQVLKLSPKNTSMAQRFVLTFVFQKCQRHSMARYVVQRLQGSPPARVATSVGKNFPLCTSVERVGNLSLTTRLFASLSRSCLVRRKAEVGNPFDTLVQSGKFLPTYVTTLPPAEPGQSSQKTEHTAACSGCGN